MKKYFYTLIFIAAFCGCKEAYQPPAVTADNNFLVVEGLINTGPDSTIITLSRTVKIEDGNGIKPETGAQVAVEGDNGSKYNLTALQNGNYGATINLDATRKYRINIKTASGASYVSDYVTAKNSPAIDKLDYVVKDNGIQILLDTRDAQNTSRYYRWSYTETWEFNSRFDSYLEYKNDRVVQRDYLNNQIFRCWGSNVSANILLASTAKLSQDVVLRNPMIFIEAASEKIGIKYSILVKQYVLTEEGFNYWQNLKKNTEQLGSIFDAQPSQLQGNIHNVANANEPVIGYISAGTYAQQRIFIDKAQLPKWRTISPLTKCNDMDKPDTLKTATQIKATLQGENPFFVPIDYAVTGDLLAAPRECVDCTLRGANKKPPFWP